MISSGKFSSMRWKPRVDEPIRVLSEELECPGDLVLMALAKLAQVAQDATSAISPLAGDTDGVVAPMLYVKPLNLELEKVKNNLSPELLQNSQSPGFHLPELEKTIFQVC